MVFTHNTNSISTRYWLLYIKFKILNWNLDFLIEIDILGSHTGQAIKQQLDVITEEFNLNNKVFKIVADQAANVKKAFEHTMNSDDIVTITRDLMLRQRKLDLLNEKEKYRLAKESANVDALNKSIEAMNYSSPGTKAPGFSIKRLFWKIF